MTAVVRQVITDKDWEQVIALLKRVYVGDGYTSAENAEKFFSRENLEPGGTMLMTGAGNGDVVGAVLYLYEDGPLSQLALAGEKEFRVLAVAPDQRGAGIGRALVQACIDRAQQDDALGLVLWSQPTMRAAHRLYESLGFVRAPERDVEDPRGFTRLVFWKSL